MTTLTSANAKIALSVPGVFPVPVPLQGFATDDAFDTENVAPNETLMGVDGKLSGGYTPYPVKLKIVLQANSPSNIFMDQWRQAMDQATDAFPCNLSIVAPSLGKVFTFTNGFLTGDMPTPPGKKIFQPQTYELTFESVTSAPV